MSEMMDMGYKDNTAIGAPVEAKQENRVRYPELYLSEIVPDSLMDKDTGDMCRIEIIAKVVDKGIQERDGKESRKMTLEIHKLGYVSDAGKKSKGEYLDMDDEGREEYDKTQLESKKEEE